MTDNNIQEVVNGGFCVGCGSCAYISNSSMQTNQYGEYIPDLERILTATGQLKEAMEFVCPSLTPEYDESVIAKQLFGAHAKYHHQLGYYLQSYAAFVEEEDFRAKGTSGGMGTWVAVELLRLGLVDGVIHVRQSERKSFNDPFYKYGISTTEEEVRSASKSRYHVVEMSEVLDLVSKSNKKYVFIGVPCMCKSLRRLQTSDTTLSEKIPYVFSLVCGHLKSINWSLSLAWGAGMLPKDVSGIQYRTKGRGIPARAYVFRVWDSMGKVIQKDSAEVAGGKYNAGALMLPACEYCDDVIGDTSDLTIGDAWLPRFEVDEGGTNLLVVRNEKVYEILTNAREKGRVRLFPISPEEAVGSQQGGYKQRREGLSYRLERERKKDKWLPKKRIRPSEYVLTNARKRIYDQRSAVTAVSRELFVQALEQDDYKIYQLKVEQLTRNLRKAEIINALPKLLKNKAQRIILKFFSRVMIWRKKG